VMRAFARARAAPSRTKLRKASMHVPKSLARQIERPQNLALIEMRSSMTPTEERDGTLRRAVYNKRQYVVSTRKVR